MEEDKSCVFHILRHLWNSQAANFVLLLEDTSVTLKKAWQIAFMFTFIFTSVLRKESRHAHCRTQMHHPPHAHMLIHTQARNECLSLHCF